MNATCSSTHPEPRATPRVPVRVAPTTVIPHAPAASPRTPSPTPRTAALALLLVAGAVACDFLPSRRIPLALPADTLAYTNYQVTSGPWSIHIVRWPRTLPHLALATLHAENQAVGLAVLTDAVKHMPRSRGRPLAAINADFYQRDRAFAGDPRGLEIVDGELTSAPRSNSTAFWLDAAGHPNLGNVQPRFEVTWPDGTRSPFGLNEERPATGIVLYTPALGTLPATPGADQGRDLVLEPPDAGPWLPLRIGETRTARIREIRPPGTPAPGSNTLVLALGAGLRPPLPKFAPGDLLQISTATSPDLRGATQAIAGSPALLRGGRIQKFGDPDAEDYQTSTMLERHPRSAFGWNRDHFFLVQVDGRQKDLSVGMTLAEFARQLAGFGCEEALNFDGGGSSAVWFEGRIRNRPCDGFERSIANALVLVDTRPPHPTP